MGHLTGQSGDLGVSIQAVKPAENFVFVKELHKSSLEQANALSRWIMASLLLVNGGALVAISDAAEKHGAVADAASYFIWGVILAIFCGIAAWFNFNLIAEATSERLDWAALEAQNTRRADILDVGAWTLALIAIAAAITSLVLFGLGARAAGGAMRSPPAITAKT
jgi:hypothetical protein